MKLGYGVEVGPISNKLTVDGDGYYSVMLGALNVNSRNGVYYNGHKDIQALFESGSAFGIRVDSGLCESEHDHPDYKSIPGATQEEKDRNYMQRLLVIEPTLVCGVFKEIVLVPSNDYDGNSIEPMVYIKGKFKPGGPFGEKVKNLLDDPNVNTAFSLRCWRRCASGACDITIPIAFDFVPTEYLPGIHVATKEHSIGLEKIYAGSTNPIDISYEDLIAGLEKVDTPLKNEVNKLLNSCSGNKCILNW